MDQTLELLGKSQPIAAAVLVLFNMLSAAGFCQCGAELFAAKSSGNKIIVFCYLYIGGLAFLPTNVKYTPIGKDEPFLFANLFLKSYVNLFFWKVQSL